MKYLIRLFFLFYLAGSATAEQAPSNMPKTCDEAVNILLTKIAEEDLSAIRKTTVDGLIIYHHGLGTTIRNEFGLWVGNLSLVIDCNTVFPGRVLSFHPDSVSMLIIEHLWKHLNTTP